MAAIIVRGDFRVQENKIYHCFQMLSQQPLTKILASNDDPYLNPIIKSVIKQ